MIKLEKLTKNRQFESIASKLFFSTSQVNERELLYKGQFNDRIRSLRRISAFTSIVSLAGLPLAIHLEIGQTIPL